jgi:carbamoyl-phosphate synthase large subunit
MSGGPRILLLSGTSLVGQSVLACLADRRSEIRIATTSSAPEEPTAFDFDLAYVVPETRRCPEQHAARFAEVLADFRPDLVIPCRDDDVIFLAAQRARAPTMARRFLCGDPAVAAAIFDKLDSARFCALHGLPFVPTLDAGDGLEAARRFAARHGFPLLGKPRCGFASRGVRLILDERQLAQACAQPDLVLQKYLGDTGAVRQLAEDITRFGVPLFHTLEQEKLSVQASIAPEGEVTDVFAFVNAMRFGRSEAVRGADDARLVAAGRSWAAAFSGAGWRGPLNVQGQRNADGTMTIFEFNGRFTGSTAARLLLGYDEVGVALRDWLGFELAPARAVADEVRVRPLALTASRAVSRRRP